jgi:glutaredoxin 2
MTEDSKEQLNSTAERIRWVALGLGSETDIQDVDSAEVATHQTQLHQKLERSIHLENQTNSRAGRLYRYSAVTLAIAGLMLVMIVSVNTAIASQRAKVSDEYAIGLMNLALNLYEEDLEVLVEQAVVSDRLLPSPGFLKTDPTSSRQMNACAQAIHGLKMVRMGFPELGLQKLMIAQDALDSDSNESNSASLDLVFNLVVGKSSFEAIQSVSQRGLLSQEHRRITKEWWGTSTQALARVSEIIGDDFTGIAIEDVALLQAAIKTDLGRLRLKFTPVGFKKVLDPKAIQESLDVVQVVFDETQSILEQDDHQDPRWLVHRSRLLNNQILLNTRYARNELPSRDEFEKQLSKTESETQRLAEMKTARLTKTEKHFSAATFEVAICYSNLADLVHVYSLIDQTPLDDPIRQQEMKFRQSAISLLRSIPDVNRTERMKENLVLNEFLTLLAHLRKTTNNGNQDVVTAQMLNDAQTLEWFVGDVLNPGIGQVSCASRIAAALILQESYPIEQVVQFLERKIESIFPADLEFLRSLIELRTSKPPV